MTSKVKYHRRDECALVIEARNLGSCWSFQLEPLGYISDFTYMYLAYLSFASGLYNKTRSRVILIIRRRKRFSIS